MIYLLLSIYWFVAGFCMCAFGSSSGPDSKAIAVALIWPIALFFLFVKGIYTAINDHM